MKPRLKLITIRFSPGTFNGPSSVWRCASDHWVSGLGSRAVSSVGLTPAIAYSNWKVMLSFAERRRRLG